MEEYSKSRLSHLILAGDEVLATKYITSLGSYYVDESRYAIYRAQAHSCIKDLVGADHVYSQELISVSMKSNCTLANARTIKGLLEALNEEVKNGYLRTLFEIVHADIFTDFMEMAEHLLQKGYKDAAAVLLGAVLEEHLRKMCLKYSIEITLVDSKGRIQNKKASLLNDELVKKAVYKKTEHKMIMTWQGLRNDAAHGTVNNFVSLN